MPLDTQPPTPSNTPNVPWLKKYASSPPLDALAGCGSSAAATSTAHRRAGRAADRHELAAAVEKELAAAVSNLAARTGLRLVLINLLRVRASRGVVSTTPDPSSDVLITVISFLRALVGSTAKYVSYFFARPEAGRLAQKCAYTVWVSQLYRVSISSQVVQELRGSACRPGSLP